MNSDIYFSKLKLLNVKNLNPIFGKPKQFVNFANLTKSRDFSWYLMFLRYFLSFLASSQTFQFSQLFLQLKLRLPLSNVNFRLRLQVYYFLLFCCNSNISGCSNVIVNILSFGGGVWGGEKWGQSYRSFSSRKNTTSSSTSAGTDTTSKFSSKNALFS